MDYPFRCREERGICFRSFTKVKDRENFNDVLVKLISLDVAVKPATLGLIAPFYKEQTTIQAGRMIGFPIILLIIVIEKVYFSG